MNLPIVIQKKESEMNKKINIININNLRLAIGLIELKELPGIDYGEDQEYISIGKDGFEWIDFPEDELSISDFINPVSRFIAFYDSFIRIFNLI